MSADVAVDKDALIHEVGALIVQNERVAAQPWDSYALVARFGDGKIQVNGFAYDDDASRPATPKGFDVANRLKALREAMQVSGKPPWGACVVRIVRETQKVNIEFEYDHPERWDVTPQNAAEVSRRARP